MTTTGKRSEFFEFPSPARPLIYYVLERLSDAQYLDTRKTVGASERMKLIKA